MKTHLSYPMLGINMLLRLWLEAEKSVVLDKKSGQNSILKAFIELQGGYLPFFSGTSVATKMSYDCTNSLQKKLILKLIQKAAVSGLQSGIRNILSNIPLASLFFK